VDICASNSFVIIDALTYSVGDIRASSRRQATTLPASGTSIFREIAVASILLDERLELLEVEMADLMRQADSHPGDVS